MQRYKFPIESKNLPLIYRVSRFFCNLLSDGSKTFFLSAGISALAGYETVNSGKKLLFDGSTPLQRKISFSRHPRYPPCNSDHKGGTVHAWGASVTSAEGRETLFTSLADNERLAKKAIVGMILRIIILNE